MFALKHNDTFEPIFYFPRGHTEPLRPDYSLSKVTMPPKLAKLREWYLEAVCGGEACHEDAVQGQATQSENEQPGDVVYIYEFGLVNDKLSTIVICIQLLLYCFYTRFEDLPQYSNIFEPSASSAMYLPLHVVKDNYNQTIGLVLRNYCYLPFPPTFLTVHDRGVLSSLNQRLIFSHLPISEIRFDDPRLVYTNSSEQEVHLRRRVTTRLQFEK